MPHGGPALFIGPAVRPYLNYPFLFRREHAFFDLIARLFCFPFGPAILSAET